MLRCYANSSLNNLARLKLNPTQEEQLFTFISISASEAIKK